MICGSRTDTTITTKPQINATVEPAGIEPATFSM
jgi:hypothetical protein